MNKNVILVTFFLFSFWYSRRKRVIPGSKWLPLMDSYAAVASLQKLYEIISETTFESTLRLNEGRILQYMKKGSMVFGCGAWLTWIMLYPFRRSQATYSLTPKISWQVVAYNHPWLVVTRHSPFGKVTCCVLYEYGTICDQKEMKSKGKSLGRWYQLHLLARHPAEGKSFGCLALLRAGWGPKFWEAFLPPGFWNVAML